MKLLLLKNNLSSCLQTIERGISESTTLPILKCFFLRSFEGKISLVSTNLEIAIQCFVPGKITEDGEVVVPFSVFNTIIKNLNSERVTLETREGSLFIITENYEAHIPLQNTKEFPIIPVISSDVTQIKTSTNYFKDVFSCVIIATQQSEIRPEIGGVYINNKQGRLTLVATDSFRLAELLLDEKQISLMTHRDVSSIIPFRSLSEILRVFSGSQESLEISIDQTQILFKTETKTVISRLVDGSFPDYKAVISHTPIHSIILPRDEFISAIKLISAFSGRGNDLTIRSFEGQKVLEILSSDSSLGENTYKLSTKTKTAAFSAVLNWKYLIEGLKIYKGEDIELVMTDRPIIMKSEKEQFLTYVVMPIGRY